MFNRLITYYNSSSITLRTSTSDTYVPTSRIKVINILL